MQETRHFRRMRSLGGMKVVAAGYIRVSRDKSKHGKVRVEEVISPETQREFFVRYAQIRGWDLPADRIIEDLDYSGYRIHYSKRPGLMELMRLADQGKLQFLLIYKIARLSRRLREFLEIYEYFEKRGVAVISVTESVDTSTPYGRAALNMLAVFAQLQSEELGEYISNTKKTQANQGIVPGTPPSYGIVRKGGKILKHPGQFPHLEEMFRLAAAGMSAVQIRKALEDAGAPPFKGTIWHDKVIRDILRNPLYIGKFRFGGQVLDGKHEPLIDPKVWHQAQRELDSRKQTQADRHHRLLSGLIVCGRCGALYNVHYGGGHARRVSYQCRRRFRPGCKSLRVDAVSLEVAVSARIKALVTNEAILKRAERRLEAQAPKAAQTLEKDKRRLEAHLGSLKAAISTLFDDYHLRRIVTATQFGERNKEYLAAAQSAEAELALVNEKLSNSRFEAEEFASNRAALAGLVEVWGRIPHEEIRELLARAGVHVTVRPDGAVLSALGVEEVLPGYSHISTLFFGDHVDDLHHQGPLWSKAQADFLLANWNAHDANWIADQIGRTERGVRQKVWNLRREGRLKLKRIISTKAQ
ncbi:MAG TPA: recombinase family protein [Bacillota bacterium]